MPTIVISGPAEAFAGSPRGTKPLTDRQMLAQFHGLVSEEACADTFTDPPLSHIGITGGQLRFVLENEGLRTTSIFQVARPLTPEELDALVQATQVQWSDGIGEGSFENLVGQVLSTSLAMAILNQEPDRDDLGEFFVDPSPLFADDNDTRVQVIDSGYREKTELDYLREAADFGNVNAQFTLAQELKNGDEDQKNEKLAVEYYQKAADQGHLFALCLLGLCYQNGTGTTQDYRKAVDCYQKAADAGFPFGMACLGESYCEGRGLDKDPAQGVEWYRRGMELGDAVCTAQLADCYDFGTGVARDLPTALELYQKCMDAGFDAVEPAYTRVKKELEGQ